jgi:serine/threonine-protein kinase
VHSANVPRALDAATLAVYDRNVAVTTTPDARGLLTAGRYRLLRELGSRAVSTFAAMHDADDKNHLFVIERLARGGSVSDDEAADYIRDARRIAELEHPNILRVREVAIRPDEVLVASDFIEGEPLTSMQFGPDTPKAPLDIQLRVIVDVLTGLGALHNLRDVKKQPLKLVHGELSPANVIIAVDGTARVVQVCRVQSMATRPGRKGSGYLAPEVLLADGAIDQRADVYSAGVLLWEALSGKRMLSEAAPHAIVAHILSGRLSRAATPADAPWAGELASVAHKALAADPETRFANAPAMAAEIRRIAGVRLATTGKVATFMKQSYATRVAARREALVTYEGSVVVTAPAAVDEPPIDSVSPSSKISTAPPPPPGSGGFDTEDEPMSGRLTAPGPEVLVARAATPVDAPPAPAKAAAPPPPAPVAAVAAPVAAPPAPAAVVPAPVVAPPAPPAPPRPIPMKTPAMGFVPPLSAPPPPAAPAPSAAPRPPPPIAPPIASPIAASLAASQPPAPAALALGVDTTSANATGDIAYRIPTRRPLIIGVAVGVPLLIGLLWAGCHLLAGPSTARDVATSASSTTTTASIAKIPPVATTLASAPSATAASPPTSSAATTTPTAAAATAPPAASTATAPRPAISGNFPPNSGAAPKSTGRPVPTYDPQGI